jgi:DNA polymerase-3 subunit delta'
LLAEAAGPVVGAPGLTTPDEHPTARLIAAGSHPDMRWLHRLENERTGNLARNINVEQVRELGEFLGLTPALSSWRAIVIDSVDELEKSAANALLKMLEEPPPNTIFFLVSHAPGRLLPTIRSRTRRLDLQALDDDGMTSILEREHPQLSAAERAKLIALSGGSAGRALAFASLDLVPLEESAIAILRKGDPDNSKRSQLASQLARKAAADRYAAFLDLLPSLVAQEARGLDEPQRERAVDAYARVRELVATAPRLSLDPAATVFQLGGILASVPDTRLS